MRKTALLIIDAQVAMLQGASLADDVIKAINDALRRARSAEAPVIFLRHGHASFAPMMKGMATWEIDPRVAPRPGELVLDKRASDGFWETELEDTLHDLGVSRS